MCQWILRLGPLIAKLALMTLFLASSAGWVYLLGNLYILFVVEGGETVIILSFLAYFWSEYISGQRDL